MKKNNKKVISKVETKKVNKKIEDKPILHINKENKQPSISKLTFAFITQNNVHTSDEKKKFFGILQKEILKAYPESKFNENHFYWYLAKYKKQLKLGLALDCLKQVKKEEKKEVKAQDKKVVKKVKKLKKISK